MFQLHCAAPAWALNKYITLFANDRCVDIQGRCVLFVRSSHWREKGEERSEEDRKE
jgi:hypothetical protein